jgi:thioredoxin 1
MKIRILTVILFAFTISGYTQNAKTGKLTEEGIYYKVTFIELGSVRCIPCQQMQPVMKAIEEKYPDQVKVLFYDVWTPEGKPWASTYKIDLIPTQVFLDETGKEFFRHEGFFPEEEIIKILQTKGVK